eukprot:15461414-Alexandrium_andersonii.AAC.1
MQHRRLTCSRIDLPTAQGHRLSSQKFGQSGQKSEVFRLEAASVAGTLRFSDRLPGFPTAGWARIRWQEVSLNTPPATQASQAASQDGPRPPSPSQQSESPPSLQRDLLYLQDLVAEDGKGSPPRKNASGAASSGSNEAYIQPLYHSLIDELGEISRRCKVARVLATEL